MFFLLNIAVIISMMIWIFLPTIGSVLVGTFLLTFSLCLISLKREAIKTLNAYASEMNSYIKSSNDINLIHQSAFYWLFPTTVKGISSSCSLLALACIPLAIIYLVRQDWFVLAFVAVYYFWTSKLAGAYNPIMLKHEELKNNQHELEKYKRKVARFSEFFTSDWPQILQGSKSEM